MIQQVKQMKHSESFDMGQCSEDLPKIHVSPRRFPVLEFLFDQRHEMSISPFSKWVDVSVRHKILHFTRLASRHFSWEQSQAVPMLYKGDVSGDQGQVKLAFLSILKDFSISISLSILESLKKPLFVISKEHATEWLFDAADYGSLCPPDQPDRATP